MNRIAQQVFDLALPLAAEQGIGIWDVTYTKEAGEWYLRVYIDKPDGVGIDDCERFSRAFDPLLDAADLTSDAYRFEVSSPGLGRRIRTDAQFGKYLGLPVAARLIRPDGSGKRNVSGILASFDSETFTLAAEGGER